MRAIGLSEKTQQRSVVAVGEANGKTATSIKRSVMTGWMRAIGWKRWVRIQWGDRCFSS